MLTVREALQMQPLQSSQVVAGERGLDNEIQWVHIVDIPDAHYEWKRNGVLLLTAGFGLSEKEEEQANLITTLVEKEFAGMVLSIGHYYDHAPPGLVKRADELGFPLIESPPDVLFIDMTEHILEHLVNQQYSLLQQSNRIHNQLTELVLQGGGLEALAQTLAELLERSVTIEDTSRRMLASAQYGPVDEARKRSIEQGRTSPEVARWLHEQGIYNQLLHQMTPLRIPPHPSLGLTMERVVAPIIVDRQIHAYIWIIAGDHPLTELDELAIQHGATVAALILFKDQAVRKAEQAYRDDFLAQLLEGGKLDSSFQKQAQQLDYDPERKHQALLIQTDPPVPENQKHLYLDGIKGQLNQFDQTNFSAWRREGLVVILECAESRKGEEIGQHLWDYLRDQERETWIGIGSATLDLSSSLRGANETLQIARSLGETPGPYAFQDLGLLHWLFRLPADVRKDNPYLDQIQALAAYDQEQHADLVHTLEVYLGQGSSVVDAADALHIHRNTLLHRLERIEEIISVDLRQPEQRLNLHVALKTYRLSGLQS